MSSVLDQDLAGLLNMIERCGTVNAALGGVNVAAAS
jgi:hypothetical protein